MFLYWRDRPIYWIFRVSRTTSVCSIFRSHRRKPRRLINCTLSNPKIYFILQLGYFKARRMFFVFGPQEAEEDGRYIQEQYFPGFLLTGLEISKPTRLKQQQLILELCNYRSCAAAERHHLRTKANQAAVICDRPVYVFRELINYMCARQELMTPK